MIEVMEGSGAYWYSHQRAYCSAFKSWPGYINASIDMFFQQTPLLLVAQWEKKEKAMAISH